MATNIPPLGTVTITATSAPGTVLSASPSPTIGPTTYAWMNPTPNNTISITGPNPTIKTDKHVLNLDDMAETLTALKERLLILTPAFEKHEKYPMLKQAYEHYKLVEKMCSE